MRTPEPVAQLHDEMPKAYKELEIQNILDSQQGTGTFVANSGLKLSNTERQNKLKAICQQYLTMASTYGFSTEEIKFFSTYRNPQILFICFYCA